MSIGVGTLQAKTRIVHPVWLAGLIAVIMAFTAAVIIASSGDEPRTVRPETAVSGTAANTPTELRGGLAGSFADTPAVVPHVPRRAANAQSISGTAGNTPSEMSGGMPFAPETASPHQPIEVNGEICHQCR